MRDTPASVFLRFLRFGALAWGGPAAQIERIREECVEREGWVDPETFKRTVAVYQVLPGPEATELCVYFGRLRAGKLGALAAGLGFVLPGFLLMLALTIVYVEADLAGRVDEIFYGLAAAVVALVARALMRLGGHFLTDGALAAIAIAAFALTVFAELSFVLVLIGAGLAYELWRAAGARGDRALSVDLSLPVVAGVAAAIALPLGLEIFFEGLKAGLLTFGGAYTVIPFLQESAVDTQGWLTEQQFVDGLALSGALPAPLIIFSTFVGYLAGGLGGGLLMTFAIFLPAFVFPIFLHRQLVALAENPRIQTFLLGVAAGVIGLIAAVAVDIADTSLVDVPSALIAAAAFLALMRWHSALTIVAVMLGSGAVGALLQLTVV
jgi:chromate transporter